MTIGRDFSHLFEKALRDVLSDRIVERLRARERSALVLLSGTDLGLRPAVASLARLCATGWRLEIRRSVDGGSLIDPAQLKELAGGNELAAPSDVALSPKDIDDCLLRNNLVLVPNLSLPLAARVSGGLTDSALPGLLAGALERGKRTIAARDGCCPQSRDRIARGWSGTPAYSAMLTRHLEKMSALGVELVWASQIAAAVSGAPKPVAPAPVSVTAPRPTERHVFGWGEAKAVSGGSLHLASDVLVTPLAAEELRARNVRLIRE